jgi:hypothetical protein
MIIEDSWSAQSGGYALGRRPGSEMVSHVVLGRVCGSSFFTDRVRGLDCAFEVGQVFVYGGLQDGVCGVEVAAGEVAHAGDLPPRDRRLGGEQVVW